MKTKNKENNVPCSSGHGPMHHVPCFPQAKPYQACLTIVVSLFFFCVGTQPPFHFLFLIGPT